MNRFIFRPRVLLFLAVVFHYTLVLADPPVASSVSIPAGPFVPVESITGSYTYSDAESDPESGTLIQWYENNIPSASGASLITGGSLNFTVTSAYRGKYIALAITPANLVDGFGTRVFSNWELVNALPQGTDDNYINQSNEGEDLNVSAPGVLGNDNSGGDSQSIEADKLTDPAHGTLTLNTNGSFVYSHDGSENYTDNFTYRVYDGYEYSSAVTVNIQVLNVNDAPYFTSDSVTTATEGVEYVYNITTADAENNSRSITYVGILPSWLSLTDYGNGTGRLSGTPDNGDVGTHDVTLRVSDGDYSNQVFQIEVSNVNDDPVLSNIETSQLPYEEGEAAKIITSTIQINDPDNDSLVSATVTIISGLVPLEDRLSFTPSPPLSTTYTQATGVFSITGKSSIAEYRTALRNVQYYNTNDEDPDDGNRIVGFIVNDGTGSSNAVTRTINFTAVNDPPDATADNYYDVPEGGSLSTTLANGVLTNDDDPDGPSAMTAHLVDDVSYGYLTFNPNGTFLYEHDSSNFLSDMFTYYAYDGEDRSDTVQVNISMTPVNDAPVLDNVPEDTLVFTEDDTPRIIAPAIRLTDEDNTSIQSARVEITQGFVVGEDSLVFSNVPGLTIEYDTLTGVLTATGTASLSAYQNNLLRNIRYWNTNTEDPNTQYRRVTFTASDGEDTSEPVSRVIEVVPWNDPPEATEATLIGTWFYIDELITVDYEYSDPDGDPEGNTTFRWYTANDDQGAGRAQITGWQTDTFTTRFSEGGKYLSAVVRPYDDNGLVGIYDTTEWRYIDAAPELDDFTVRNFEHPGAFAVGQTVKADFTYYDLEGDPEGTHEFQWYRSNTPSWLNASEISGEVRDSFEIRPQDNNRYIALEAIPHALDGSTPGRVRQSEWFLVSELPSAVISGEDSICNDGSTTTLTVALTGNNPPWSFRYVILGSTDTIPVPNIQASQAIYPLEVSDTGTYVLVDVSDTKFDFGVVSGEGVVAHYPNPGAIMIESELTICGNDQGSYEIPVNLTGKAPWEISYQYSEASDSSVISGIDTAYIGITVSIDDIGNYDLLHVWDANCMASGIGSTEVLVKESPLALMEGDTSICPNDTAVLSVELTGVGPWTFSYTRDEGDEVVVDVLESGTSFTYELEVMDPGIYDLVGVSDTEDEGCANGSITVDLHDIPTATIGGNEIACEGSSADFEVALTGIGPWAISYQQNTEPPDTIEDITVSPYMLTASQAGNYAILEVQDAYCAGPGTGIANLVVEPLPEVAILGMDSVYGFTTLEVPVNVSPVGGDFDLSDHPGAIYEPDPGQYVFLPFYAYGSTGSPFWIRYRYTDPGTGCENVAEHRVIIIQDIVEIQIEDEKDMYCFNDSAFEILGVNIRNEYGSFSITEDAGLVDGGEGTAWIYPGEIEEGNVTVTYTAEIDGEMQSAQKTLSFNKITADFSWDNECMGEETYINFEDASNSNYDITGWNWSFNFPGDTLEKDTSYAAVRFNDLSRYTIDYIVSSSFNDDVCFDTIRKEFSLKPTKDVAYSPYIETFSQDTAFWSSFAIDEGPNSWTYGTPTGGIWSEEVDPSERAWYTALPQNAQIEQSYIISPCFNFRDSDRPMIKMDMWKGFTQQLDGAVLQYTTNNGLDWKRVGEQEDGIEWYNENSIYSEPGGQTFGWTGLEADEEWVTAKHKLDIEELKTSSPVRFRIAFASSGFEEEDNLGLAIDNIWIGERKKKVLFEHFTNSSDEQSAETNPEINALFNAEENIKDVIDIQYHLGEPDFGYDPFYLLNPEYVNSRKIYYGVNSVPYGIIDGGREDPTHYRYEFPDDELEQNDLTLAVLEDNLFNIVLGTTLGPDYVEIDVTINANEYVPQKELILHMVIMENRVTGITGENEETEFESVFKTMLPDAIGTRINRSWQVGSGSENFEFFDFTYEFEDVFSDTALRVVAFLQDVETKRIYQAEIINPYFTTGLEPIEEAESRFTVFPNPAVSSAIIRFDEYIYETMDLEVHDLNGKRVYYERIFPAEAVEIPLDDLEPGLYFIKISGEDELKKTKKLIKLGNRE